LRALSLDGLNHTFAVEQTRRGIIQSEKPRAVRHHLLEREVFLPRLRELRPKLRERRFQIQPCGMNRVERAGTGWGFRCGPDQNESRTIPRFASCGITKTALERKNLLAVLENTHRRANLAALLEISAERLLD